MTAIERDYQRKMFSLTGEERVCRSVAMFEDVKRVLAHKIRQTQPEITDSALRIALAKRMYWKDAQMQALLRGQGS